MKGKSRTTEEFIDLAKSIHGYKYDYSKVYYTNQKSKITIICPIHGEFKQEARYHISNNKACKKCAIDLRRKVNKENFIKKAKETYGNKYNYSLIDYKNNKSKVRIICPEHGIFEQTPNGHLVGECLKCGYNKVANGQFSDTEEFIQKSIVIHKYKYDYSKVNYKKSNSKIIIICPIHGEFNQKPNNHLQGKGCQKCGFEAIAKSKINNKEHFIKKSKETHGDRYDYSISNYKSAKTKLKIICPEHGEFMQTPNNHINGKGCPKCKRSLGEEKIAKILASKNVIFETEKTFNGCVNKNKLRFDFYLSDYNICIEHNGIQHYKPIDYFGGQESFNYLINNDRIKKNFCKNNNIELIVVRYDDDINQKLNKLL